jgi:fucose permease
LNTTELQQRRRNARRTAFALMLVAFAFYVGFIIMSVSRSHG